MLSSAQSFGSVLALPLARASVAGALLIVASLTPALADDQALASDLAVARAELQKVSLGPRTAQRATLLGVAQDSFACWSAESTATPPDREEAAACRADFWAVVGELQAVDHQTTRSAQVR
ncbi:hypothetical protein [Insolitispirillum peregrinum]|uniref:UrcA family protein n=1 Tax=Insolitispirillum peregrinum TaxID=80876 RepID=A0A1N7MUJ6_9PROT|nr:hypothetical protein [Insolitispirillum peregrinum]SIS89776.1 hypothetical protein SAMN05421779_104366 [Insolitispirillum peregrinum]